MNSLRAAWTARIVSVLAIASVLAGAIGVPMHVVQTESDEAPSQGGDEAQQAAVPSPVASRHVLRITGVPAGAELVSGGQHVSRNYSSPGGAGLLMRAGKQAVVAPLLRTLCVGVMQSASRSLLHGIVWPMGP